jgi:phage-related protein
MAALPLQDHISQTSTYQQEYRSKTYDNGDGLSYRVQDGIGAQRWYANFVFTWLNTTNYSTLKTFLDGIGSWGTFDFTPPGATSSCMFAITDKVSISDMGGGYQQISFPARQEWA